MRGELRERLFTGATDTDQKRMATRVGDDAADSADVLHCVFEQHEIHRRICLVVLREGVLQNFLKHRELVDVVVDLFLDTTSEVAEDERLGVVLFVELLDARNFEELPCDGLRVLVVRREILDGNKTIRIHALRLVQPQLGELVDVVEVLRSREEQALKHVAEVAHRELVVEVHRSLAEARDDLFVVRQRSLNQLAAKFLAIRREVLEMPVQEGSVDLHQGILPGEVHRERHKQPLQTGVDGERTRRGVHARHILRVVDHLRRELLAVEPVPPAEMLADLRDRHRGVVRIELWHVQIIDEVDELVLTWRSIVDASLLLQLRLKDLLERQHIGEVVEVDVQAHDPLGLRRELTLHECGLTSTGGTDEHDGRAESKHHVEEVRER